MAKRKHVIVGSGPAALSAVDKIRSLNRDDEIKLVSRESYLPYSPTVLPYLLAGRVTVDNLWLRDEAYFRKAEVTFSNNKEVIRILPDKKQVVYRNGDTEGYDNLLIASGAETATQPIEGLDDKDVLTFHTLDDYYRLNGRLRRGTKVAILGAGMVAIELAIALAERGNKVQVIGRGRPLRAYFDEPAGGYIRDILTSHGIAISTGKTIGEVGKNRAGIRVSCTDGEVFDASLLVSCLGVKPSLRHFENSEISTNEGILVDSQMKTNLESIYAAGDVAEALDFFSKRPGISAILPSAIAQGKVAGANMAGEASTYAGWLSMNQLKIFGNSACSIGIAIPQDKGGKVMEESNNENRSFKRLVIRDNKLIGAMFFNVELDPGVIRYLIENQVDIGDYEKALFEQPKEISRWLMLKTERVATT